MLELSAAAILRKNNPGEPSAWIVLLEIQVPGDIDPIRICSNNEVVAWGGYDWTPFPFELDPVRENTATEVPVASIRVSNVTRDVLRYLELANGAIDFPVIIRIVNSAVLGNPSPELEVEYIVKRINYDTQWITFTLGGSQHITRRTPERRYMKNFCPFKYGDVECGADAATMLLFPACDHSLANCRERENSERFGGEPGIPTGGLYVRT